MSVYKYKIGQMLGSKGPLNPFGTLKLHLESDEAWKEGYTDFLSGLTPSDVYPRMTLLQAINSFTRVREWEFTLTRFDHSEWTVTQRSKAKALTDTTDHWQGMWGRVEPYDYIETEEELAESIYQDWGFESREEWDGDQYLGKSIQPFCDEYFYNGVWYSQGNPKPGLQYYVPADGGYFGDSSPEKREVLMPFGFDLLSDSTGERVACGHDALFGEPEVFGSPTKVGTFKMKFLDYESDLDVYGLIPGSSDGVYRGGSIVATEYWSHGGKYNTETGARI